ncbi:MAG: DPP IV N-terminal domain-containing protein [Gemmatimonadetes bacterium]|nr:DPP IV N-terminal domain-containing protein [Gemmatimonadota bacterium]
MTRLTTGADSLHVNGMSDWVRRGEMGVRDGFRWSPDGTRIAYWHFDMTGVHLPADQRHRFALPGRHPDPVSRVGTTNSAVTARGCADGGATTWLQIPGDPRENYLPYLEWVGAGELLAQRINRLQNSNQVTLIDATNRHPRIVFTERDAAWLDQVDDVP